MIKNWKVVAHVSWWNVSRNGKLRTYRLKTGFWRLSIVSVRWRRARVMTRLWLWYEAFWVQSSKVACLSFDSDSCSQSSPRRLAPPRSSSVTFSRLAGMPQAKDLVRARNAEFERLFHENKIAEAVETYTHDGKVMPAGHTIIVGRQGKPASGASFLAKMHSHFLQLLKNSFKRNGRAQMGCELSKRR